VTSDKLAQLIVFANLQQGKSEVVYPEATLEDVRRYALSSPIALAIERERLIKEAPRRLGNADQH
jgi:hypothetical protein